MTEQFDIFVESIISFADLPASPPYGFWVGPNDIYAVPGYNRYQDAYHYDVALQIIDDKGWTEMENKYDTTIISFLESKGFIRCVCESHKFYIDTTYIKPNIKNYKKQIQTAKDLAMFYDLEVVYG